MLNHTLATTALCLTALAHAGASHDGRHDPAEAAGTPLTIEEVRALERNRASESERSSAVGRSGSGELTFEVAVRSDRLPQAVFAENPHAGGGRTILEGAHGGFAFDYREGRGEVYWFLQGAGVLRISADLSKLVLVDNDPELTPFNLHNATFFEHDGQGRIAWPANDGAKVFITGVDGKLIETLGRPTITPYTEGADYRPTDTAYMDGMLWITDGYGSKYVMSYDLDRSAWTGVSFGGATDQPEPGKFGTNHGVTIHGGLLWIAGRQFARIHSYRPDTEFVDMFAMPEGSKPCDFEFFVLHEKLYGVAASLNVADGSADQGASIYIVDMETLKIVSTIKPKDELGLEKFVHLHNVFATVAGDTVSLYCQSWNPGDFAILRSVASTPDGASADTPANPR